MQLETKKPGKWKRITAIITILLIFTFGLLSFQIWKKPVLIDSGMISPQLTFAGHSNVVRHVMFSPDGELLASASFDNTVKIWQKKDGKVLRTLEHPTGVTALAFSPDGNHIATGSFDSIVRLWNVADGKLVHTFAHHSNDVFSVAFSPDGAWMASASEDKTVGVWHLSQGK